MYGLIGKNLSHSISKKIHGYFGNDNYELFNIESAEEILNNKALKGFNVTIPYKTEIIPFLDVLDEVAKKTNSVNTVIRKDNLYYGYNTDYYGFIQCLKFNKINVQNKNILIIGNGSVSNTIKSVFESLDAMKIDKVCRRKKQESDILFSQIKNQNMYQIIVNTTPVGMYPNNDDSPLINLKEYTSVEVVIDLIYNPLRTKFLLEAQKLNIKIVNGLYMLIMQAKKAHELFFNINIPINKANNIFYKIQKQMYNLVFIGLPLSGKSKYASLFGKKMYKHVYDTDFEIETKYKKSIPEIFLENGEEYFRDLESELVDELYKKQNIIISTGGGLIKRKENIEKLKQNGIIIFLNKNPEDIAKKEIHGRPLIKSGNDIIKIAKERLPIYKELTDITIDIHLDTNTHLNEIKEKFYEYINNKRS